MSDCRNYGPFLDPYYNTEPNMKGTQKGTIILTTTHWNDYRLSAKISYHTRPAQSSFNPGILSGTWGLAKLKVGSRSSSNGEDGIALDLTLCSIYLDPKVVIREILWAQSIYYTYLHGPMNIRHVPVGAAHCCNAPLQSEMDCIEQCVCACEHLSCCLNS